MKKKEKVSLANSKLEELMKIVHEAQAKLAEIQVNRYSKQSRNAREARSLRQKIAVSKTMMRLKELQHEQK